MPIGKSSYSSLKINTTAYTANADPLNQVSPLCTSGTSLGHFDQNGDRSLKTLNLTQLSALGGVTDHIKPIVRV